MRIISLLSILIFLSACTNSQGWPPKPANIHLGKDSCAKCKMIISQTQYGGQIQEKDQPAEFFDDLGCLLAQRSRGNSTTRIIYVRSFPNGNWLKEDQAFYAVSKEIMSPMGYGIVAFSTKESAENYAKQFRDSKIYTINELVQKPSHELE
jgi:copper chaperone NosL